jgi:uncharacterized membrane protein YgcG
MANSVLREPAVDLPIIPLQQDIDPLTVRNERSGGDGGSDGASDGGGHEGGGSDGGGGGSSGDSK